MHLFALCINKAFFFQKVGNTTTISLYPSGYDIGSCNWIIQNGDKKVGSDKLYHTHTWLFRLDIGHRQVFKKVTCMKWILSPSKISNVLFLLHSLGNLQAQTQLLVKCVRKL